MPTARTLAEIDRARTPTVPPPQNIQGEASGEPEPSLLTLAEIVAQSFQAVVTEIANTQGHYLGTTVSNLVVADTDVSIESARNVLDALPSEQQGLVDSLMSGASALSHEIANLRFNLDTIPSATLAAGDSLIFWDTSGTAVRRALASTIFGGGAASVVSSFTTIDCPLGTDPVATSLETLQLLTTNSGIKITGAVGSPDTVLFELDINGLTEDTTPLTTDFLLSYDVSASGPKKVLISKVGVTDASGLTFTPNVLADWSDSADPGNTDDALDQLADRTTDVENLLPPSAPALDDIDYDTSSGIAGKNTWNVANPLTGYTNLPGDGVDTTFSVSGSEHGIYAHGSFVSCIGTLNEDVTADPSTPNAAYPANSFSPGGSENTTNTLKLLVNGSQIHSVDITSDALSGNQLNGNGSGFTSLSVATDVVFPNGSSFPPRQYRTGGWKVVVADLSKGYNEIKVQHTRDAGTVTTDIQEIILDDSTTATTFSSEVLDNLVMSGSVKMSGVEYHTGGTADYDVTINNGYRNTYKTTSLVTFNETNVNALTNESFAASGGDRAKTHVITNKTVTVSSSRHLNQSITVSTSVDRTVQSDLTSTGVSIAGLLMDPTSSSSTDLVEDFNDEDRRLHFGSDFNTNLSSNWDEAESLVGASANYNDGLQTYNGALDYPSINFGGISNGPAGNPNYSAASGVRYFARLATNATGTASFRVKIDGSYTLISDATAFTGSSDQIKVSLRWPTLTGWLDLNVEFNEGDFGATSEASRFGKDNGDSLVHGCHSTSLDSGSAKGVTIGTKTSANSSDKLYLRVITPSGWTGTITKITVTWDAS